MATMRPSRALAIEASSSFGAVALAESGQTIARAELNTAHRHTAELLPSVQRLLREIGWRPAELRAVFFSHGPGSFTGLRVSATIARMLQWSIGCDVVATPTLEVIARNALARPSPPEHLAVILDAKRGQVYSAYFERSDTGYNLIEEPALRDPAQWLRTLPRPLAVIGEGIAFHRPACIAADAAILDEQYWRPNVEHVVVIGQRLWEQGAVCEPSMILPLYIRRPEAEEVYEQRRREARERRGE